jgi:hypothetical protein
LGLRDRPLEEREDMAGNEVPRRQWPAIRRGG